MPLSIDTTLLGTERITTALTAAETGHLVLATLHSNDAAQSIDRMVDVFPPHDPRPRPWHLIGPDLCVDPVDLEAMVRNSHRLDQATQIADVLLDQRAASGIGNVYKSEVLWACRTDPFSPVERLPDPRRLELYATAARQLRANLGRGKRVTFQRGLAVYGRGGRDCPRCHATIRSDAQGPLARVTYWCPRCQPAA